MSARKTAVTVASATALAMAIPAVKHWEGYAPTVVPDRLANGLPTGGYGETEGVKLGETHDEKFWSDRLAKRLAEDYDAGIGKCIRVDLPDSARAAAISVAYNAGVGALCGSAIVKKWNAGDVRGGCEAIRGWRVGSHPRGPNGPLVIQRGLQNRRNDEARICLSGLDKPAAKPPVAAELSKPAAAPAAPAACPPAAAPAPRPSFWARLRAMVFKS
jgi:lysozyme